MEMIRLLNAGKRIINIDETWLNETSFTRRVWSSKGGQTNVRLHAIMPRLSMIAAMDTDGKVWFSLSHATTDSDVIALFFNHLVSSLDRDQPGWQDSTVFLWDNAPYHSSNDTQQLIHKLGLQIIYSGPYSYSAAPVETLFS